MKLDSLNWNVEKVQLFDGVTPTPFYATKRMDTGLHLGIVAKNYALLQNSEVLEVCNRICGQMGYELHSGHAINGGKRTLLSVKTGNVKVADDNIISQISITNSFDRSSGIALSFIDTISRCSNEFSRIIKNKAFSFEHNSLMKMRIEDIVSKIELLNKYKEEHYNNLERFVNTSITKDLSLKAISEVLDMEFESENNGNLLSFNEDISTRKKNQFLQFVDCWEIEQKDLDDTLYCLVNSATRYSTHVLNQVYFGKGQEISNKIYDKCLQLI